MCATASETLGKAQLSSQVGGSKNHESVFVEMYARFGDSSDSSRVIISSVVLCCVERATY